jgi:hypothetical protein
LKAELSVDFSVPPPFPCCCYEFLPPFIVLTYAKISRLKK